MARILIAPDSFKGSATAVQVAQALAAGWKTVRPDDDLVLAPTADGGEGTLDAFELARPGACRMPVRVTGPDNRPVDTHWLLLPDDTAVVELAATSGLMLLDRPRPLTAHTRGFGQAIAAALDHGVRRLLLAIGGSSSTDGGVGALRELGAEPVDSAGRPIGDGGVGLLDLAELGIDRVRPLPPDGVTVLTDVTHPLLGPTGAAAVFGPQKGADAQDITLLETALARLAALGPGGEHRPGAGAAGGTGYGLLTWGARLSAGAAAVAAELGIPEHLRRVELVLTGEGRFDDQSRSGKVAWYLLTAAAEHDVPTALVAGSVAVPTDEFVAVRSLTELAGSADRAMADPVPFLTRAGREIAAGRH